MFYSFLDFIEKIGILFVCLLLIFLYYIHISNERKNIIKDYQNLYLKLINIFHYYENINFEKDQYSYRILIYNLEKTKKIFLLKDFIIDKDIRPIAKDIISSIDNILNKDRIEIDQIESCLKIIKNNVRKMNLYFLDKIEIPVLEKLYKINRDIFEINRHSFHI